MLYVVRIDKNNRVVAYKQLKNIDNVDMATQEVLRVMINWYALFPHSRWEIKDLDNIDYEPLYSIDW